MIDLLLSRLRQGMQTSSFPKGAVAFPERFRGLPVLNPDPCEELERPPTGFLTTDREGRAALDIGACLFSPEEAGCGPAGAVTFSRDHRMASRTRQGLVSSTGEVELATALDRRMRSLFRRSLRLRSVVAGSCSGCEAELVALGNVVFDLSRFGVQFVASPRHADGIVITGTVNRNMRFALEEDVGSDAGSAHRDRRRRVRALGGALSARAPRPGVGVPSDFPVDLWVPGCPPHPLTVLDGLLRLLDRLPRERLPNVAEATARAAEG